MLVSLWAHSLPVLFKERVQRILMVFTVWLDGDGGYTKDSDMCQRTDYGRMFIINAVITLPLGIIGFWVWPGTPSNSKSVFLTQQELALAKERLERAGHTNDHKPFSFSLFKKVFFGWKLWILVIWDIFFWNACLNASTAPYLLWLKSLKKYSKSRLSDLSATAPGLGIFYVLFICFGADLVFGRAGAITIAHSWNLIGVIILLVWDVPKAAKFFAYNTSYSAVAMSSVL